MKNIGFCKAKVLNLIVVILAIATCIVYGMADAKVNFSFYYCNVCSCGNRGIDIMCKTFPYVEYIPFLCILIGMAAFIKLAFDEIGDVLSKINMNGLSSSWIASAVLIVATVIAAAVSTVFVKEN